MLDREKLKEAIIKALIVLVPTYSAAYWTEKMVWVVPTLAATGFFASTISFTQRDNQRRVEEDGEDYDDYENAIEGAEMGLDEDAGDG